MTSNTDQFNRFIKQASQSITCDSACQKQKQTEKLKQDLYNAKINLVSAPNEIQVAEKNYVTYTEGSLAYNELLDSQLEKKASVITTNFIDTFNNQANQANMSIETYAGLLINFNNVVDLFTKYKKENISLIKELKQSKNEVFTNHRKTYYEDQEIDGLNFTYFYLLFFIYVLCVICFVAFTLIFPSNINWIYLLIISILLIILPFCSTFILSIIIWTFYKMYYIIPKNVYK